MSKLLNICVLGMLTCLFTLTSCDDHLEFPDTSMHIGDIVCSDGTVVRAEEYEALGKTPVAVVFYINHDPNVEGVGYAVYKEDIRSIVFADTLGVKQNTSADVEALDGKQNTAAITAALKNIESPMARIVLPMLPQEQSAYIPSVAQMQLLYMAKGTVNSRLSAIGTSFSDEPDECWYWTSTEVAGQEDIKAWLYSIAADTRLETPKDRLQKVRPIFTIY